MVVGLGIAIAALGYMTQWSSTCVKPVQEEIINTITALDSGYDVSKVVMINGTLRQCSLAIGITNAVLFLITYYVVFSALGVEWEWCGVRQPCASCVTATCKMCSFNKSIGTAQAAQFFDGGRRSKNTRRGSASTGIANEDSIATNNF
jgi:hypothetical protein